MLGKSVGEVEAILRESAAGASLLLLDAGATRSEVERSEAIFVAAGDAETREPAIGLCTSGSTGLPKVVELEWASLLRNAGSFAVAAGYQEDDVLWCTTPLAHLYCFGAGVLGGLLSGATVLLGKGMLEPEEFARVARDDGPTVLLSVQSLYRRSVGMLEQIQEGTREWRLGAASSGGEA